MSIRLLESYRQLFMMQFEAEIKYDYYIWTRFAILKIEIAFAGTVTMR